MDEDLEAFIQKQKSKLAKERSDVVENGFPSSRKKWQKDNQNQVLNVRRRPETPEHVGLQLGGYEEKRKKIVEDQTKDLKEYLAKKPPTAPRRRPTTPQHEGLPVGRYQEERRRLAEERNTEMQEVLKKQREGSARRAWPEENQGLKLSNTEEKQKLLNAERQEEYKEYLKGVPTSKTDYQVPENLGIPIGERGATHIEEKLAEERRTDYQNMLKKTENNRNTLSRPVIQTTQPLADPTDNNGFLNKFGAYEERKKKLDEERRRDFQKLQAEQKLRSTGQVSNPAMDYAGGLPSSRGTQLPYENLKEREYTETFQDRRSAAEDDRREPPLPILRRQPPVPDNGFQASLPGVRDHPSAEEALKRSHPTPRQGWASPTYEEILDRKRKEERSYRRLNDTDGDGRIGGANYMMTSMSDGHLNKLQDDEERKFRDLDREYESKKVRFAQERSIGPSDPVSTPRQDNISYPSRATPISSRNQDQSSNIFMGREVRRSAEARKKEAYRQELLRQMEDSNALKIREKREDLKVNATGAVDPTKQNSFGASRRAQDNFSPRKIIFDDQPKEIPRPRVDNGGLLETGFKGLFDSGSNKAHPYYGTLQVDDAYSYYATVDPMDNPTNGSAQIAQQTNQPSVNSTRKPPIPSFEKPQERNNNFPFRSDDDVSAAKKSAKLTYQQELQKQIEEQKAKKRREKEEKERYDRKIEEEIRNYDPFGKGGGGAPLRDEQGNVVADLRSMHMDNEEKQLSPRNAPPPTHRSEVYLSPRDIPNIPRLDGAASVEQSHARGGHGIFGDPKSDVQKNQMDRYREDLRKQIEDKKKEDAEKKRREDEEEQRSIRKWQEQQDKLAREFEEEKKREREKREQQQRVEEEQRRKLEEERLEAERIRKNAMDEKRKQRDDKPQNGDEPSANVAENRSRSPPIPTLQNKTRPSSTSSGKNIVAGGGDRGGSGSRPNSGKRSTSPPLPAQRSLLRKNSADVLSQLANLKEQLHSERQRVENALEHEKPEIYDPRTYQRVPHTSNRRDVDIFDLGRQKPVSVRPKDDYNLNDEIVRKPRRVPVINDRLEAEQLELLKAHQNRLKQMKESPYAKERDFDRNLIRPSSNESATLLASKSEYLPYEERPEHDPYSLDKSHSRRRNDSARSRRRNRFEPEPFEMGSQASLNVDAISKKNEERLKKLRSFGDEHSNGDPDEILDKFMTSNKHSRPPSGRTLQDETWLRPGTGSRATAH
ncbi:DgyrCDS13487 [Dimorphilus gyrociliatus]|uniref:DgyrCDS13487 n=1 Tax=Dimorphilus gyrociliatus TaxID=2664684 RepID=A0A7I8WAS6_9ANNE|nr:DgyrCDS13487 [Dimorphilus gyrociliatus]